VTQSTGKEGTLDAATLSARLTAVTTAIGDAITALEQGGDIDLTGIDEEVEFLCLAAAKAAPAARNNIADMLDLMTERLEILGLKLRENLGGGDEAVQEEAARARAHDAYRSKS
jgi:hypothetical protein